MKYDSAAVKPYTPLVSVVIPTFNEEKDIARTIEALLDQKYTSKEIIVVDDSNDRTPQILSHYLPRGIQVIRESHEGGRCGARNLGIRRARGEIVVILNADVCPDPEFLDRILPHYRAGADLLVVQNRVANIEHLLPRYIDAEHKMNVDIFTYAWTEGFSCRREAALTVGLFPVNTPLPYIGGEDMIFGEKLAKTFQKVVDPTIVVAHYFPATLKEFCANRRQRGWGGPVFKHFSLQQPIHKILAVTAAKTALGLLEICLLFPLLLRAWKLSKFSARGRADLIPFAVARLIEQTAIRFGEWGGNWAVIRKRCAKRPISS